MKIFLKNYKDTYGSISQDIRCQIEHGEKNFILYPFGVNGAMAKEILQTQFGLMPAYIIDNKLCNLNSDIHPVEFLDNLNPDDYLLILTIENPDTIEIIRHSAHSHFPHHRIMELFPHSTAGDFRITWLRRFSEFAYEKNLSGNVAECGVNQGDFAQYINRFFPDRKCYLFDSFEGFREQDIAGDDKIDKIDARYTRKWFFDNIGYYKATNLDIVMKKMPHPENIVIRQGYIPETLEGVEDSFCFVNLDMDVYPPMLEGLRFFYPRMVNGGLLLLHDYYSGGELTGVEKAVYAYEKELGTPLCKIPSEISSSLIIVK
ncbi:MAG: hypothetical protein IJT82_07400 [Schwartzia sp.]|nr:hypothetical protein [Schwartzia sp. (in: firmicutes)]